MREPGLVDVDDAFALSEIAKHVLCVEHSQDFAALGVAVVRHPLDDPVAHPEVLFHDRAYERAGEALAVLFLEYLLNLSCLPDRCLVLNGLLDN